MTTDNTAMQECFGDEEIYDDVAVAMAAAIDTLHSVIRKDQDKMVSMRDTISDLQKRIKDAAEALMGGPYGNLTGPLTNAQQRALLKANTVAHAILTSGEHPPSTAGFQEPFKDGTGGNQTDYVFNDLVRSRKEDPFDGN